MGQPSLPLLQVFVGSPSDVAEERRRALEVVRRLNEIPWLRERVSLESVAWEEASLPANLDPQAAIARGLPRPSQCDVAVFVFQSRMGTPLPSSYVKPEGGRYLSGTEWELRDSLDSADREGRPIVLVYRSARVPPKKDEQLRLLEEFFDSALFRDPDGSIRRSTRPYDGLDDFERRLEKDMQTEVHRLLDTRARGAVIVARDGAPVPRHPEAAPPAVEHPSPTTSMTETAVLTLRNQLCRARESGLHEAVVARDFAWPLFEALAWSGRLDEARGIWSQDLRDGDALDASLRNEGSRLVALPDRETVSWVHLSDFHFKADLDHGRDEVFKALLDDIAMFTGRKEPKRGAERIPIDFLVVSGDLAFSGKPREYEAIAPLFGVLLDALGLRSDRVFVVPGNHDVDRDGHEQLYARDIRSREKLEEYWSSPRKRRRIFAEKLAAYREFASRLNPTLELADDQPGGFLARVPCGDRIVAIAGLSSSWLGEGGDADAHSLITGKHQVYDLIDGPSASRLQAADLKIAILHHPLDWMQDFDRDDLTKLLAKNFDVVLRGHLHETSLGWQKFPGHELHTIAAGSAYAGSGHRNAYNVVQVTFGSTRRARVWLRAYSTAASSFVKDVETYAAVEDGTWEWDLPGEARERPVKREAAKPAAVDLRPYLRKLEADHAFVEIRAMGAQVAERLELETVFTRLRVKQQRTTVRGGSWSGDALEARTMSRLALPPGSRSESVGFRVVRSVQEPDENEHADEDDLSGVLLHNPHMVLIGDPGSGKTTFLSFVALNLARAQLAGDRGAALQRIGLQGEPPFPVFVRLGPFGKFLLEQADPAYPEDSPEHFYRYVEHAHRGFPHGLPGGYLKNRILEGDCMLLLDGLDEVPGEETRRRVVRIIDQVVTAGKESGNRHVATARTRSYRGTSQFSGTFEVAELADFEEEDVDAFVANWSRALYRAGGKPDSAPESAQAAQYGDELRAAIRAHPSVRVLTASPLMLTVLAVVHWNRSKLPEQRAELYQSAVDYLLDTRRELSGYKTTQRLEALRAVALRMQEDPAGVVRTLGRGEAAEVVRTTLGIDKKEALDFLDAESLLSGVLVSRIEGEVEFWHLTFQEYLAALELSTRSTYWENVERRLPDPQWSEVLLLLGGCLRKLGIKNAAELIRKVVEQNGSIARKAAAVGLAGRILRDIEPYGGDASAGTGFREALDAVLSIFRPDTAPVAETIRVDVGEALGSAGDPRLDDMEPEFVSIPGESFWMGTQKESRKKPGYDEDSFISESPVHRVTVSDFQIARYPTTVAQFERFVNAGKDGYDNEAFWTGAGWALRSKAGHDRPASWSEQLRHPNRPVIGVSWHEADAYCRWLAAKTRTSVALPTEAQWEFTARGPGGRKYPWGAETPTDRHANIDGRVGRLTPVAIYPLGATPEGIQDLAGNVWEWTSSIFRPYPYSAEDAGEDASGVEGRRVLRGGSWGFGAYGARAACRYADPPVGRDLDVGFRVVRSSPISV